MPTPLRLATDHRGDGTVVLYATGELDLSNVDEFERALDDVLASQEGATAPVTVDLSKVGYLDSGAINTLFTYANRIRLIANSILMPVLKVSGLADEMTVQPEK